MIATESVRGIHIVYWGDSVTTAEACLQTHLLALPAFCLAAKPDSLAFVPSYYCILSNFSGKVQHQQPKKVSETLAQLNTSNYVTGRPN